MNKLQETIYVPLEYEEFGKKYYHIPSPVSTVLTLCGWVDVDYEDVDASEHRPNCPECITVMRYCKGLKTGRLKN